MLAFIRDGAGISTFAAAASDADGGDGGGRSGGGGIGRATGNRMGGLLRLDPGLLATLEAKGTEALVVAFVEGGDVDDSVPGWGEATKALQGQVRLFWDASWLFFGTLFGVLAVSKIHPE